MQKEEEIIITSDNLTEIFNNNLQKIISLITIFINDEELIIDVVRDVFYILSQEIDKLLITNKNLHSFLLKTTRDLIKHSLEDKNRDFYSELKSIKTTDKRQIDSYLVNPLLIDEIENFINNNFSETEQQVFKLKYFYYYSLEDIAEILQISTSDVSIKVQNIAIKLNKEFEGSL